MLKTKTFDEWFKETRPPKVLKSEIYAMARSCWDTAQAELLREIVNLKLMEKEEK